MAATSKSPKRILQVAHQLNKQKLRTYWHRCSPKKFTLPQLFACLVLKEFLRLDYRKLSALLADAPTLAATIGLKQVPHFSTFQKAAARLLISQRAQRLLDETIHVAQQQGVMKKKVAMAAIDGTGFETRHISAYFVRRRDRDRGGQRVSDLVFGFHHGLLHLFQSVAVRRGLRLLPFGTSHQVCCAIRMPQPKGGG